ncbi:MAG: GH3 auxin-responsive promoter family protein [Dehalococcoidia bacterium]|nr:GH3 auxin-responsive promoter family protein [Dehalococcoidia bacterium]
MSTEQEMFRTGNKERIWQKYCGFFDLSLADFMELQEQLLLDHIELIYDTQLAKKFMPRKPKNVSEFRKFVPLTTYSDYVAYLGEKKEDFLAVKPCCWTRTSGRGDSPKWVPYTDSAIEMLSILSTASSILACTKRKGEVDSKIGNGIHVLHNLPPAPYITGTIAQVVDQKLDVCYIPSLEKCESMDFETRTQTGFQIALRTGVDLLVSLTSVLLKIGERFTEGFGQLRFDRHMLHPQIMWRLMRGWVLSKREGRPLLPKDLWPLKGLLCYGTDTAIYRDKLIYYWGKEPMENYGATEVGLIALHAWNKKNMTFVPFCCFLELAPEEEWLKSKKNKSYLPSTVLLDEVKPGECYEVIITSFYGMPFLRYRLGDLIRIVALEDDEAGIKLPQMVFESRADDLIDIAGFPRLDEKTIWQAIANTRIKYEDWSARKEYEQKEPVIRLYIELKERNEAREVEKLVHQELLVINRDYRDTENMLGIRPLRVTLLPAGAFQQYYDKKKRAGAELSHLKPPHMNASDAVIRDLLGQAQST